MAHRPNILALASKISLESLTYTGITYGDPEYRILDPIVDDDMCSVMMRMRLETDFSAEDLAKKTRKSLDFVQTQCDKLVKAGVIRTRVRSGVLCYYYPIWVPGIMEGILSNREQCDAHPELGACFEEYTRIRVGMLAPMLGNGVNFMRVMPVMSAIENDTHKASYDEISTLIEKAWAISVGPCSCRRSRRLMGEGCGHLEEDMCLYLNDNAISFSRNGEHRLITKEEAYDILRRAEDNGLVHEVNQALGFDDVTAICNCCGCSCYALRITELFRSPNGVSSNFIARVDKDKCVACGQCVENCQTNAVRLGQKHCLTDSHISDAYASDKEIPWDKKSYNIDYRTTRTDTMPSGTAPCKAECPAHVPVQGYIKLAAQGRYTEALELIKKENPFPAVCGRICNKACEDACTRGSVDAPIAIDDIKKFIAGKDLEAEHRFVPKMVNQTGKPYEEKIAVIGSGPAGLTCAYYLALKGYPVTVFEKEKELGGMLTLGIPSFRLEKDVIRAEIDILRDLGVQFKTGVAVGTDITLDALRAEGFKAFYLAVGASRGAKLRFLASPAEILGDGKAETLKIELMELRGGKPAGTGVYETMNVSAVISAVGQEIELNGISVDTGAKGTVTVSLPSFQTSEADVFAGGDVVTGPKFAIDAIAAGKEGAISIHRYVHPGQSQVIGRDHRDYKAMNPATAGVAIDGFDTAPRQKASGGSAKDAEKTFRDLRGTLTEEQLKTETRRCLDCGTAVVDESLCVGCGICTTKCKFDAIRLEKVTDYAGTPYFKALLGAAGNAPAALAKLVVKKVARP